jgi:hypothetical protein
MEERVLKEKFVYKDINGKEYNKMLFIIAMIIAHLLQS